MMKEKLALTDEQSAKLETSRKTHMEKMKAVREDKLLSDEQKKEKVKELMKQQKDELKSVLTEEQFKKLKQMPRHHGKPRHKQKKAVPVTTSV